MTSNPPPRPFYRDSRGNRLENWLVEPLAEDGHRLWLRGPVEVRDQVKQIALEYQDGPVPAAALINWTHVMHSSSVTRPAVTALLELLTRVVTLPVSQFLEAALTLDWYKISPTQEYPYWRNTTAGNLVSRGKYWYKTDPDQQAECGRQLAGFICQTVRMHALLAATDAVLDVPGHDSKQVSFGSRLAATVARDTGKPFIKVSARDSFRPEAKSDIGSQRAEAIGGQFYLRSLIAGLSVVIVDDVFRSGASMADVARAARVAGATKVFGMTAVRTMRG